MDPSAPPSFTSDNENNSGVPAPPPPPATNPYAANLVSGGPMCSPTATTGYGQATAQPYPMAGTIGGYPPQQSNIPGTGCTPSQPNNMQVSGNLPPQPTVQGYGYPLSQPNAQGFGYSPQQPNAQGFGYSPQQPNMQGAIYPPPQAPYPGYGPPMSIPSAQPGYPPQTQFSQSGYGPQITGYANPTSGNNYGGGGYPSPMTQQQNLNNVNPRLNTNMSNLSITGSGVNNKGMPLTRVELKVHAKLPPDIQKHKLLL